MGVGEAEALRNGVLHRRGVSVSSLRGVPAGEAEDIAPGFVGNDIDIAMAADGGQNRNARRSFGLHYTTIRLHLLQGKPIG